MEDFTYTDIENVGIEAFKHEDGKPEEKVLDIPDRIMHQIRLTSVYKGVSVPSLLFDSTGTKKIAALASYIVEALEKGRILIIDELDSSIHFKLTRAIAAMFNNELNYKAQMIFTAAQGVRDTTDVIEKYKKGALGAMPEPELMKSLLEMQSNNEEGVNE